MQVPLKRWGWSLPLDLNYSKWVDQMHFKTIFFWLLLLKAKMTNSGHLPLWGLFTEKPVVMIMMHARRINFLMIIYLLKNWISILKIENWKDSFGGFWKIEKVFVVHLLVSLYPILYGRQSWNFFRACSTISVMLSTKYRHDFHGRSSKIRTVNCVDSLMSLIKKKANQSKMP